jgi:hypothetical protein
MMTKRNETEELAALLEQAAAELRLRPRQRNWIDQFRGGEALPLSRAAEVAGADAETVRRWCVAAEYTHRPLGYLVGGLWLVDAPELLCQIGARRGERARCAAEGRLKKYREQQLPEMPGGTAG